MEDRKMLPSESWTTYRDAEDRLRNEAAIRTALMTGAEFVLDVGGQWQVKGIDIRSETKSMPAWLWLATLGIGIDKNGNAVLCKDLHFGDLK